MKKYFLLFLLTVSAFGQSAQNITNYPVVSSIGTNDWLLVSSYGNERRTRNISVFNLANSLLSLGLTNFNLPWVSVSSKSLLRGETTIINDGMDYGPDTPGTTTSGIQEAINSFSLGTNGGANGIYLKFGYGNYFFTNVITYSNNWDYEFVWEGVGKYATRWVYAGTDSGVNTVYIKGGGNPSPSLNCSGTVKISDGTFSSILMKTNVLLCITNENEIFLERVHFSGWKKDTMQDWLSTTSGNADQSDYTVTTNGLVGAVLGNVNDAGIYIKNVQVGFLGAGLVLHSDHVRLSDFIDPNVGANVFGQLQTAWPITHPYRSGAGIIRYPGLDAFYQNMHGYSDRNMFALMNYASANTEVQQFRNVITEGATPAFTCIVTNQNLFNLDSPFESDFAGPHDLSNWGQLNTNDFSATPTIAPIKRQSIVWNDPAYLKNTVADEGLHLRTGQFSGNARGVTNIPGIYPIARLARSTNTFNVIGSKSFNVDGIWSWNSTTKAYTNSIRSDMAAIVDTVTAPPNMYMNFTNAAHPSFVDYVAAAEFASITNTLNIWVDNNVDIIPGMLGWWSETTNNEAFISGRLENLRLPVGSGGGTVLIGETTYLAAGGTVTLPDIRTNAGRVYFIKNDDGQGPASVTTVASQVLEGGPISILAGETYGIQAMNGKWRIISKFMYNAMGLTNYVNGLGLTNLNFRTAFATNRFSFTINNVVSGNASVANTTALGDIINPLFYAGATNPRMLGRFIAASGVGYMWGQAPHEKTFMRTNCAITCYFLTTNISYFGVSLTASVSSLHDTTNSVVYGNGFSSNDGTTLAVTLAGTNYISVSRVFSVAPGLTNAIWQFAIGAGLTPTPTNSVWFMHANADFY